MELILALVVGGLFAAAVYTLLRRSIIRIAIGLILLGHAANLLIFTAARLTRYNPPIVPAGEQQALGPVADPVPQALILTAIVISFGVVVFALVLIHRVYQVVGSDDLDDLTASDHPEDGAADLRTTDLGTADLGTADPSPTDLGRTDQGTTDLGRTDQ